MHLIAVGHHSEPTLLCLDWTFASGCGREALRWDRRRKKATSLFSLLGPEIFVRHAVESAPKVPPHAGAKASPYPRLL